MAQPLPEARIATIGSYRLYVEPDGKLFVNTGTVKLRVTPDEARDLLDYMLLFASHFSDGFSLSNAYVLDRRIEEVPQVNGDDRIS